MTPAVGRRYHQRTQAAGPQRIQGGRVDMAALIGLRRKGRYLASDRSGLLLDGQDVRAELERHTMLDSTRYKAGGPP